MLRVVCFVLLAVSAMTIGTASESFIRQLGLLAAVGFAWTAFGGRGRVVSFNIAAIALSLAVYLSWADANVERQQTFSNSSGLSHPDADLGHRPDPNFQTGARMTRGEEVIYDTTYTFDADALRIHPEESTDDPNDCVLFFGCSFTFGEGVGDDEAMPYVVGTLARGRYRVRNFAYSGYGPHHMLAAIETGLVERVARCTPKVAIYQAHPHHALRASGKWWWDEKGPRYVQAEDGSVARQGNFTDVEQPRSQQNQLMNKMVDALPFLDRETTTADDVRLLHGIVRTSQQRLAAAYPGITFHVLYWDIGNPALFTDGWYDDAIEVHRLSRLFGPGEGRWPADWEQTLLLPHDVHPTAATHARIARYVAETILALPPQP